MKYLLYYNSDNKFVTDQTTAGGDGTKVVSVVDGVAWTGDAEKVYYRLSGEATAVTSCTVTIHHVYTDQYALISKQISEDEVYTVEVYNGKTTDFFVQSKSIENYTPAGEESVTLKITGNTEYTFYYDYVLPSNELVFYETTMWGSRPTENVYYSTISRNIEIAGNGLVKAIVEEKTSGLTEYSPSEMIHENTVEGNTYQVLAVPIYSAKTVHKLTLVYDHELTKIEDGMFSGIGYDAAVFPDSVTAVGNYSFSAVFRFKGIENLLAPGNYFTLPGKNVQVIGKCAFRGMGGSDWAENLIVQEGVRFIDGDGSSSNYNESAFGYLESIELPSTLEKLGRNVFIQNKANCTIKCHAKTAPQIYYNTFRLWSPGQEKTGVLYYPEGSDYSEWLKTDSYYLGYYDYTGQTF